MKTALVDLKENHSQPSVEVSDRFRVKVGEGAVHKSSMRDRIILLSLTKRQPPSPCPMPTAQIDVVWFPEEPSDHSDHSARFIHRS